MINQLADRRRQENCVGDSVHCAARVYAGEQSVQIEDRVCHRPIKLTSSCQVVAAVQEQERNRVRNVVEYLASSSLSVEAFAHGTQIQIWYSIYSFS